MPRDHGVGWDFADVTDHYVELLFGESARTVRYADTERYFALCRAATGEVMARAQGLWRREESTCKGALIWWLQDLWEGQGLGIVDSSGLPKSPYYFLKRAWSPVALWFVDEGTDGLALHAANDGPEALSAQLELALYRADGGVVERASDRVRAAGARTARVQRGCADRPLRRRELRVSLRAARTTRCAPPSSPRA